MQLFVFVCRWACFCQSLTEINIAVQQLDEVDREVKLWSHIGGGHYVSEFCGHYCICYCLYRSRLICNIIVRSFTSDTAFNDVLMHALVCKLSLIHI